MIRAGQVKYDQQLIHKFPRALYGYVRDKSGLKLKIGQVVKTDGALTVNEATPSDIPVSFSVHSKSMWAGRFCHNLIIVLILLMRIV